MTRFSNQDLNAAWTKGFANLETIRRFNEEHMIRAKAKPGESFADFVRRWRGSEAGIRVTTLAKPP